jgi:hypothetical protein
VTECFQSPAETAYATEQINEFHPPHYPKNLQERGVVKTVP